MAVDAGILSAILSSIGNVSIVVFEQRDNSLFVSYDGNSRTSGIYIPCRMIDNKILWPFQSSIAGTGTFFDMDSHRLGFMASQVARHDPAPLRLDLWLYYRNMRFGMGVVDKFLYYDVECLLGLPDEFSVVVPYKFLPLFRYNVIPSVSMIIFQDKLLLHSNDYYYLLSARHKDILRYRPKSWPQDVVAGLILNISESKSLFGDLCRFSLSDLDTVLLSIAKNDVSISIEDTRHNRVLVYRSGNYTIYKRVQTVHRYNFSDFARGLTNSSSPVYIDVLQDGTLIIRRVAVNHEFDTRIVIFPVR